MFKVTVSIFSEVDPADFDTVGELVILAEEDHEGLVLGKVSTVEMDTISAVCDPDFPRDEFDRLLDSAAMEGLVYDERV